ncbi:hypothetical protein NPIL_422741 [Nephila pilipes]|uniref:Uncharacterized protein n=1 Tax=Nephila pilipes TaxID=299642 RepID=A0A8X6TH33_NEPPI|nr:hypothetical protein NPIL_422741 [Nephila pilipes]
MILLTSVFWIYHFTILEKLIYVWGFAIYSQEGRCEWDETHLGCHAACYRTEKFKTLECARIVGPYGGSVTFFAYKILPEICAVLGSSIFIVLCSRGESF